MPGLSATYKTENPPCGECKSCEAIMRCLTIGNVVTYSGSIYFNALTNDGAQSAVKGSLEGMGLTVKKIATTTQDIRSAAPTIDANCAIKSEKVVLHKDRP